MSGTQAEATHEDKLRRELAAMEAACREEAERALKELERRARTKIADLKADNKALRSRNALLEGKAEGERVFTQAEVDALLQKTETACYSEAHSVIQETEQRAREAIAKWRRKAKDLGDKDAAADEQAEQAREAAEAEVGEFDISKYRWSDRVAQQVMKKFSLTSVEKLVEAAMQFDNGDRYLNKQELEEGARVLTGK